MRMLVLHGTRSEDREQPLFVYEVVWTVKQVRDVDTKITQLVTTFKDCSLLWYMKYLSSTPTGHNRTLTDIKKSLIIEFKKSKSKS